MLQYDSIIIILFIFWPSSHSHWNSHWLKPVFKLLTILQSFHLCHGNIFCHTRIFFLGYHTIDPIFWYKALTQFDMAKTLDLRSKMIYKTSAPYVYFIQSNTFVFPQGLSHQDKVNKH